MAQPDPSGTAGVEVQDLLDRVPGWRGRARVLRTLDGGITNRNLLIEVGGERFVLRLAGKDTELLEIRRHDEREAANRAASLDIGPEVVAFLEPECYLVSRFIEAEAVTAAELSQPDLLAQAATMLRRFHQGPPLDGDFDVFRVPELHRAAARSRGVVIPGVYQEAATIAARIEGAFARHPEPRVPGHNDLLTANFLRDGTNRLWLLDWEYAGNNDRYFDLGNFAVNNQLEPEAEARLIDAYFGPTHIEGDRTRQLARLRLMKVMSDFREAMWAVVQLGISGLDFDYLDYATQHFERLHTNASTDSFGRHLQEASGP